MPRRVAHLMSLLVLLILPAWAQNPATNSTPLVTPEIKAGLGGNLQSPITLAGCFTTCVNEFYPAYCSGLPPGPEQQMCGDWVTEICRCQCGPVCQ